MFVFVALRKSRRRRFQLRDVATTIVYGWCGSDAGNRQKRIDIVAKLFDLLKLTFQPEAVGLRRGHLARQFLQLVFDQAIATGPGARARLSPGRRRPTAKLKGVGCPRLIIRYSGLTLLQIGLQPLLFLQQITKRLLTRSSASFDR